MPCSIYSKGKVKSLRGFKKKSDTISPFKIALGCENGLRGWRSNTAMEEARAGGGDGKRRMDSRYTLEEELPN